MKEKMKRRRFIEKTLQLGSGLALVPIVLQGCQSSGDESTSEEEVPDNSMDVASCDDLSKTPEAEIKKREGFGYVEESPMPEKDCKNCNLHLPAKEGQSCGGCALFKGPVFEEAYCTYWAPIV